MKNLSKETIQNNILSFINNSNFDFELGQNWYFMAKSQIVEIVHKFKTFDSREGCLIVSILSPANKWATNLEDFENLLYWYEVDKLNPDKRPVFFTYGQNVEKCLRYLKERKESGLFIPTWRQNELGKWIAFNMKAKKTYNFYFGLVYGDNPKNIYAKDYFTIDRHMLKIAGIDSNQITPKQYEILKSYYLEIFEEFKDKFINPSIFQAVLWCNYVYLKNGILHY